MHRLSDQPQPGPYDILVQRGSLQGHHLHDALSRALTLGLHPAEVLIDEQGLTLEQVGEVLARFHRVPFQAYDPALPLAAHKLAMVKPSYLRHLRCVPLLGEDDEIVLVLDDPANDRQIREIRQVLKLDRISLRVSIPREIHRFLGFSPATGQADIRTLVDRLEDETAAGTFVGVPGTEPAPDENTATIIQLVNQIITDAASLGASDIHLEPGRESMPAQVRFRIDGLCRDILQIPANHVPAVLSRIKIMARLDIAERRKPQDGKFSLKTDHRPVDIRVATLPTVNGESAVLRLLVNEGGLLLDQLHLAADTLARLHDLMNHPHGLFLVAGPTGSGKTTTLHALLGHLNTPERKIWTAEDPVEITQPGLQQVQVHPRIGFDFNAAMRAFLRADPDIILIGEMRDRETAHTALEASLTGHLVLSTLHTNSAPETIIRLLDLGLEPLHCADALLGILAQRLVRVLCSHCKRADRAETGELKQLAGILGESHPGLINAEATVLYRATGCSHCGHSGYRGRMGIHELLVATPTLRTLIGNRASVTSIRQLALQEGMRTLLQDGALKVIGGHTDLRQLARVVVMTDTPRTAHPHASSPPP
ncbi:type II/IV secretion system protein [Candidatus Woesearchaeota archaeon]|jgi:type II secretory ATPase GspE/PulE/Tfp pilus assembly ATPase PilB-like protein|nr:type II/IV secretion system protein [Candidatus Woesearchaeota archaeon]